MGWYRKEFTLPKVPKDELERTFWKVRFEGANYRTKVWLNGRTIGGYTGYFPFEADLDGLRKGRNTLVVKVSSLRSNRDLTHWRPAAFNGYGTGGWWNFGGLLREVYVRKIDTIDIEDVHVLPHLPKVGGPAKVDVRAYLRNMTGKARDVDLVLSVGRRADRGEGQAGAGGRHPHPDQDVHDQAPASVAARQAGALPDDRVGRRGQGAPCRVPAALRRTQAGGGARRGDPAQRPSASTCTARASTRTTARRAARCRSARARC